MFQMFVTKKKLNPNHERFIAYYSRRSKNMSMLMSIHKTIHKNEKSEDQKYSHKICKACYGIFFIMTSSSVAHLNYNYN